MNRFRSAVPALLVGLSLAVTACGGPSSGAGTDGDTSATDESATSPDDTSGADDASRPDGDAGADPVDATRDPVPPVTGQPDPVPASDPAPAPDPTPDSDSAPAPGTAGDAEGDCSASGAQIVARPSAGLPREVVALRDFLLDAALRCDEQLLRTAMDESDQFTHTFGGSTDAIGDWWELEAAGEAPFLRMAQVLGTTPALADGGEVYVWPQVATGRAETTTDAAWAELTWLDDPARDALAAGGYLDWRLGISADGQWRFFVAGD